MQKMEEILAAKDSSETIKYLYFLVRKD